MDYSGAGMQLLQFILPIAAVVITTVVTALLKKYTDKIGLEHSKGIDEAIDRYVPMAVSAAQTLAQRKLGTPDVSGADKLNTAVSVVLKELEQSGIKNVGEEIIVNRIEGWLSNQSPKA